MREPRSCGECTACCNTHGVAELSKPGHKNCVHCQTGVGCRIYETRPISCQVFKCSWLIGMGAEEYRPDKTGIVPEHVEMGVLGHALWLYEEKPGKLKSDFSKKQTRMSIERHIAVLHNPTIGPMKLFIPEALWSLDLNFNFADVKRKLQIIKARPEMFL